MKKIALINICLLFFIGCSDAPKTVQQNTTVPQNINAPVQNAPNDLTSVSSHSQDKKSVGVSAEDPGTVQKSGEKTKWTQSGNPIDVSGFDSEIKQVQDKMKANPKNEDLKKSLADAYLKRGMALTEARQYATALGDYRKVQKLDPENEEAKKWIAQIVGIYESINRSYPGEGEEPPPLPFKK